MESDEAFGGRVGLVLSPLASDTHKTQTQVGGVA